MKKMLTVGLLMAGLFASYAQTNDRPVYFPKSDAPGPVTPDKLGEGTGSVPADIGNLLHDVGNGPWASGAFIGHSYTGTGKSLAGVDLAYSFATNNVGAAGLVVGYDYLWSSSQSQLNTVKGGAQLTAVIRPFAPIGIFPNATAKLWAADLIATPNGNNNNIANIVSAGISFDAGHWKNLTFDPTIFWQNRSGQGWGSGNYICASVQVLHW